MGVALTGDPSPAARLAAALHLVGSEPDGSLAEADAVLAGLGPRVTAADAAVASLAHRVAGLALRELGRLTPAEDRLRRAVRLGDRCGDAEPAAEARMSLAYVLVERGRLRAALATSHRAAVGLRGVPAARLRAQHAIVLARCGRTPEAVAAFSAALPVLVRAGDRVWEARARNNRALLRAYLGDPVGAVADLRRARDLHLAAGQRVHAAETLVNLAWATGMAGDVPGALELFDRADVECADLDIPERWLDRAEVLLRVGLAGEADEAAARAQEWASTHGSAALAAEALLLRAQCGLAAGDHPQAVALGGLAAGQLARQGRPNWAALAGYVRARAAVAAAPAGDVPDRVARRQVRRLEEHGWPVHAADLRLALGQQALADGRNRVARDVLRPLAVAPASRHDVLARRWHARALLALADGRSGEAMRALHRGWALLEAERELLGAAELRASVAGHTADVVGLGTTLAVAAGRPAAVFAWSERGRAAGLRHPRVRPPRDPELAHALDELRAATRDDEAARLAGEVQPGATAARRRWEQRVVHLTRQTPGHGSAAEILAPREASDRCGGGTAVVQYVAVDDAVHAVVTTSSGSVLRPAGRLATVTTALRRVAFVLRRLAAGFGTPAGLESGRGALREAAAALDGALVRPLLAEIGDRAMVVSAPGSMAGLPWALLPSCAARPVVLAPSVGAWCRAHDRARPRRPRVLAVAGPGLPAAADEVRDVAAAHPTAVCLSGEHARARDVLAGLQRADLAHLAAHGWLSAANPQLSRLELSDGGLTGYDLERLRRAPHTVLLPACHAGAGVDLHPDETLGLAWTLLAAGAASVVAATTAVPDAATRTLMSAVHRRLAVGAPAAVALVEGRAALDLEDPAQLATAAAFVSYGA